MKTVFSPRIRTFLAAGCAIVAAVLLNGCVGYYDPYASGYGNGYSAVYYNAGYYGGTYYPAGYYYPGTTYYPGYYMSSYYPSIYTGGYYYNRPYYNGGYYNTGYYNKGYYNGGYNNRTAYSRNTYYRATDGTYRRVSGNPTVRQSQVRSTTRYQGTRASRQATYHQRDYRRSDE